MRKKVELLAPAGSMDALYAAIQNGCDAVYLGGSMYGARAFANNFSISEMKEAVAYAHVYGVRVFVTVNTLLYETEIATVTDYIKELQDIDVDALIIQDIGLFSLIRETFPDMELHASTQMHIHNPEGINLLKEIGAARVVVPRETPLHEICEYAKLGVDLEVFVQGALCVSYSGQCLMSAKTLSRSGNRGECAQSCRMRYTLEKLEQGKTTELPTKGEYLLSPKDLNTLDMVPQLIEAGTASFKIEGRMKRPEYVALMVSLYRKAIDAYEQKRTFHVNKQMEEEMQKIFHRGFTNGHLFQAMGSSLMNPIRPNHMGVEIGKVEHVNRDKIRIRLIRDLYQGDGVRILKTVEDEGFRVNKIYNERGLLVNMGKAGQTIELDKVGYIEKGSRIVKTSDVKQLDTLRKSFENEERKVAIKGTFTMQIGKHPILTIQEPYGNTITITSELVCELARKTPLSETRIKEQLEKTGDTPFIFQTLKMIVDEEGIFLIKELNRMRRDALDQCLAVRKQLHPNRRIASYTNVINKIETHEKLLFIFHTKEQFLAYKEFDFTNLPHLVFIDNKGLYEALNKQGENVYCRTPRLQKESYVREMDNYTMIQEHGGYMQNSHTIVDTSLNITNSYAAAFAFAHGADIVSVSLEQDTTSIQQMVTAFTNRYHTKGNFATQVYGHLELMLSEYCPINACEKDNDKKNCALCRKEARYQLKDIKGHTYPILTDTACRMHLLSEEPMNDISRMDELKTCGISSFSFIFTIEDKNQTTTILHMIKESMYE